ncbi:diguanylate cyclase domain-containing protein [Paracoccus sp. DMF]|uniref:GGDEF domain-containing response regulator n=1 Tax=Paracoccus sp. DMF TaxID=400837 RepID=UPI0021E36375|nr:diguanylate cyclase [Paracoccus sp. DMF]MCV2446209.1 diguanylate cyclase [Paracoccus sp. DMF]
MTQPIPPDPDAGAERPRILIVDDIAANLTAMRVLLRHMDAEIMTAQSGNEALSLALDHRFALVLLDVQMPGMDGFEVATLLRDGPFSAETPIIFMTASNADEFSQLRGYDSGAIDYIGKPINERILLSKVGLFLELYRSRQQLMQALAQVHRQGEILRATFDAVGDGIIATDNQDHVSWMNPAAERMTGWTALGNRPLSQVMPLETAEGERLTVTPLAWPGRAAAAHVLLRSREGKAIPISSSASVVRDPDGQPIGGVVVFQDATQAYARHLALQGAAETDPLTGLLNRAGFNKRLLAMLAARDGTRRDLALLFGDLDKFKPVNDNFGHAAGDVVLKEIAARLNRCVRDADVAARWAGDEFAVLMPCDEMREAEQMAERLSEAVRQPIDIGKGGIAVSVGISIGISMASAAHWDHGELLEQADRLLYRKKAQRTVAAAPLAQATR